MAFNIYRGHFVKLQLNKNDTELLKIYTKYLRVYGEHCEKYLPPSKEMTMDEVCDLWEIQYNGYGAVINTNYIRWKKISKIYARRDLYMAQLELERFLELNF